MDADLRNISKRLQQRIIVKINFVISLICQNICALIMPSLKMRSTLIWRIQYVQKRGYNLLRGIEMKFIAESNWLLLAQSKIRGIRSWISSFRWGYSDLRDLLLEVITDITFAYKINLWLLVSCSTTATKMCTGTFTSQITLIFWAPVSFIQNPRFEQIELVDKDVVGINYQRRPSNGLVIAVMPNV